MLVLAAAYGGLSAFYFYASDGVWEQLRMAVPDFVVAMIFALDPETRIMPTPPRPAGVAIAAMVSVDVVMN